MSGDGLAELAAEVSSMLSRIEALARVAGIFYDAGRGDEAAARQPWRDARPLAKVIPIRREDRTA